MDIKTGVIKSHPYKLHKLVKMGDEQLNKKLAWHDKYDEAIMFSAVFLAFILSVVSDIYVYNKFSEFYPLTLWYYLLSAILSIGTVFFVSSGYNNMVHQLIIIPNEDKYQWKINHLIDSSKEAAKYAKEAKELNRTLRLFDLDIMQCIADTENWINERKYTQMIEHTKKVSGLKTIILER